MMKFVLAILVLAAFAHTADVTCGKYLCDIADKFRTFPTKDAGRIEQVRLVVELVQYVKETDHNCREIDRDAIIEDIDAVCASRGKECTDNIIAVFNQGNDITNAERSYVGKVFDYAKFAFNVIAQLGKVRDTCKSAQ